MGHPGALAFSECVARAFREPDGAEIRFELENRRAIRYQKIDPIRGPGTVARHRSIHQTIVITAALSLTSS